VSSVERLNRLLALVPYARRHPGITVGRMAAAFGVTPAQLRKDLQMLVMTGLPGMAGGDLVDIAWEDGFVRVTDPQVLDLPVRFTAAEATALLVGLRALAAAASPEQRREIDAVTDELAAVAGDAAQAAARISVPDDAPPPAVDVARQALTSGR
jgi:proteasome accessory factor C